MSEEEARAPLGVDPFVWATIFIEGSLVALALLIGWLADAPALATWRWEWAGAGWGLLAALPMLAGFYACLILPWPPLLKIRRFINAVLRPILAPCSLVDLFGISVLAGVAEELLFRGVLQVILSRSLGSPWAGAIAAGVLFGVMHAVTPGYALFATVMGIGLGVVFLLTDNLLAAALAHVVYDFVALVYLMRWMKPIAPLPADATKEAGVD